MTLALWGFLYGHGRRLSSACSRGDQSSRESENAGSIDALHFVHFYISDFNAIIFKPFLDFVGCMDESIMLHVFHARLLQVHGLALQNSGQIQDVLLADLSQTERFMYKCLLRLIRRLIHHHHLLLLHRIHLQPLKRWEHSDLFEPWLCRWTERLNYGQWTT